MKRALRMWYKFWGSQMFSSNPQTPNSYTCLCTFPLECLTGISNLVHPKHTLVFHPSVFLPIFPIPGNGATTHPVAQTENLGCILHFFNSPYQVHLQDLSLPCLKKYSLAFFHCTGPIYHHLSMRQCWCLLLSPWLPFPPHSLSCVPLKMWIRSCCFSWVV